MRLPTQKKHTGLLNTGKRTGHRTGQSIDFVFLYIKLDNLKKLEVIYIVSLEDFATKNIYKE